MGHFSCGTQPRVARSRKYAPRVVRYHERYRAIKLMRKEERGRREESERERDGEEGLSPNGLRNALVGPRHAIYGPGPAAIFIDPFRIAFPPFVPDRITSQLHLPCVIGVLLQADLRHACPLQNFREIPSLLPRRRVLEHTRVRQRLDRALLYRRTINTKRV